MRAPPGDPPGGVAASAAEAVPSEAAATRRLSRCVILRVLLKCGVPCAACKSSMPLAGATQSRSEKVNERLGEALLPVRPLRQEWVESRRLPQLAKCTRPSG